METAQKEEWRQIEGYPDYYVSSLGRIKSVKYHKTLILKPSVDSKGYAVVSLSQYSRQRTFSVHRLVLIAFTSLPLNEYEVNHIDGIKNNNRLVNLEWVTKKGNAQHAWRLGLKTNLPEQNYKHSLYMQGEGNPSAKLSKEDVGIIRQMKQAGYSCSQITKQFNVHRTAIYNVISGRTWKSI